MAGYTKVNLKDDVEDQAPNFGLEGKTRDADGARAARAASSRASATSGSRRTSALPFGHQHKTQEEVYVVLSGSLRAKLEDEVVELRPVRRAAGAQGHDARLRGRARGRRAARRRRAATRGRATRRWRTTGGATDADVRRRARLGLRLDLATEQPRLQMASHALLAGRRRLARRPDRGRRRRGAHARARRAGGRAPAARPAQPGLRRVRGAARRAAPPRPVRGRRPVRVRAGRAAQRWREVALWWPERRVLVRPTRSEPSPHYFALGGERLGVHPLLRADAAAAARRGSTRSTSSAATARACTSERPRPCATRSPTRGGGCRACALELPRALLALTTIGACFRSSRDRCRRRRRAERRRCPRLGARRRVRHAARRLLRADDPRRRARLPRGGAGRAAALQPEGVPERRAPAAARGRGLRRRRLDARRARVRAQRRDPRRADRRAREQQERRGAAGRGRGRTRASSCSTRSTRSSARPRPACGARSCASRPGSRPTRTRRSAPPTTARSSACRPTTRWPRRSTAREAGARGRGRPPAHRLAARSTRAPALETIDWLDGLRAAARELGWTRGRRPRRRPRDPLRRGRAAAGDRRVRRDAARAARRRLAAASCRRS